MPLLPLSTLNVSVALLSLKGQKALRFHQKYLNLCSDKLRSTARIKFTPSFIAYTFVRCYANLPTPWRRGVFKWAVLGGRGRILTFIKNISLGLRLKSLQLFRSYIAQTVWNTPKTKENMKSHHMTPIRYKNYGWTLSTHYINVHNT